MDCRFSKIALIGQTQRFNAAVAPRCIGVNFPENRFRDIFDSASGQWQTCCHVAHLHFTAYRGVIYVLEPVPRGARKLNASAMPAIITPDMSPRDASDQPILYRSVPLTIRRAARKFFTPA
jgi:hypothetical protein